MPVAQFPGVRSWGYDGVHPFAVQHSYGGPEALQRLVGACHLKGMAVALDVVYNHFGPEGNVLTSFGDYLTDKYRTDWGSAVNFDGRHCDPVRSFVLQAVRMWVRDYHIDVLRFDAADQIYDRSPCHILCEAAEVAHAEGRRLGRPVHVFAETDLNDAPRFLRPAGRGGCGFDGHWNDDFHHALHAVLTGESNGYYRDFADGPAALAKVLEEVFVNNGTYSEFRGRRHGAAATEFPGSHFCAFTQNHDQVGNRARSDRYDAALPASAERLAAGVLLLAPRLPLLFMGQEYGETNPFPFFCDFREPSLIEAVRKGRKEEFAYFGWKEEVPDPVSAETAARALLSWSWHEPRRAGLRRLYADLLRLRRAAPALRDYRHARTRLHGADVLEMKRGAEGPEGLTVLFNLSGESRPVPEPFRGDAAAFRSDAVAYGGEAADAGGPSDSLAPHEFLVFGDLGPGQG
jgi:maltooligosyltrehalose trehalohydrolase